MQDIQASPPSDGEAPLWRALSALPMDQRTPDALLDCFLSCMLEQDVSLYPAQEEAMLALASGQHVVLATPTGSGKSLVAQFHHFLSIGQQRRSCMTSPIKALAHEKFFDLCRAFGPTRVGLLTGDASVNRDAPILCATAEVLANMALAQDNQARIDDIVMDEFHYFGDAARGTAWQIPLLASPSSVFLLMSATLGDTRVFEEQLSRQTSRAVAHVASSERPVPLDFAYSEVPMQETIVGLVAGHKTPLYVVHFSQREAIEAAQATTSVEIASKEDKLVLKEACQDVRFDTPFGQVMRRLLLHGIGLHHAGLLPKYRLLTERLARAGLLRVIMGTDTLGVGINVPIRTVVLSKLCKFDGTKVGILSVRDFRQIVGRAGRKGYDTQGSVLCQAPEHVIENRRMESRVLGDTKKLRKLVRKKPPAHGFVPWDQATFEKLQRDAPETIRSQFALSYHLLCTVLRSNECGYRVLMDLIAHSFEPVRHHKRLRREAKRMVKVLLSAHVVVKKNSAAGRPTLRMNEAFGDDFSLTQALTLFVLHALPQLDAESESYALDVLSIIESILESPQQILKKQIDVAKDEANKRLKAEGKAYEERIAELESVTHEKPLAEMLYPLFDHWTEKNPWASDAVIRPKSIARRLVEDAQSFSAFVKAWGLERHEGVLLRYIMQTYRALLASVPAVEEHPGVSEIAAYLRTMVALTDKSLIEAWETLDSSASSSATPALPSQTEPQNALQAYRTAPKPFVARIRAQLHTVVLLLAKHEMDEAARLFVGEAQAALTEHAQALVQASGPLLSTPIIKQAHYTQISLEDECLHVRQTLLFEDPEQQAMLLATIDADASLQEDQPILRFVALEAV